MALKLDGFVLNGTEYEIQDSTARAQIAEQVASRTQTNADFAAEVIDGRVGVGGKTYPSLGEAIRGQFAAQAEEIQQLRMPKQNGTDAHIMGDGVTAIPGFLQAGQTSWYDGEKGNVAGEEDTFWMNAMGDLGILLQVANSHAGTKVSFDGSNADTFMAGVPRIQKLGEIHPTYVFVLAGMEDMIAGATLGTFEPTTVNLDTVHNTDLSNFATAYKTMVQRIQHKFPNTRIVLMWYHLMSGISYATQYQFAEVAEKVAKFYGCQWIDFRKCGINMENNIRLDISNYPTRDGHLLYQNYLEQELR